MRTAQTTIVPTVDDPQAIRPFEVQFLQNDLDDLRQRVTATRFPEKETVDDNSQGIPLKTVKAIAKYWANDYDFGKLQRKLNAYPQFVTEIGGLDIHFIHVRAKERNALPIIITHGWPGSVLHQMKIICALANPTSYGGKAEDAFDVIIPSIPGFGFSGKPNATGWNPTRIASAWIELMKRLGYDRFVAQGGDWGALITEQIGVLAPPELIGLHTNMPAAVPAYIDRAAAFGEALPSEIPSEERQAYEDLAFVYKRVYYAHYMASRPQTLAALADSPVGMAAFMADFDARGLELIQRAFDGVEEGISRDDLLDNFSLFWLTNTAVSAGRIYWENKLPYFSPKGIEVPVAVSVFPDELYRCPKSWAEVAYPNLIHYNKLEKGGHFPAWEQPEIFVDELRNALRKLRTTKRSHENYSITI
ncbi:epoxide hydrolase [Flavobacterium sp. MAH-1]|uniref:Epoxide hydrolase n=1 Tax=Flavobacterium agri TaxID=2743471 RepID=A0A7Y8XZ70_9FLAO|nr:epoxide hydrolase family protein [Flavobacterium agri]NUY79604.1 epoxide hydrolase [Flavobacterium agri]NYA69629.1 epoxide hydrolase [Flavobacterium agri]